MRPVILFAACLSLLFCFHNCRQQETKNEIYTVADSLLSLTLGLQLKISSPEIQRMHDFQQEINRDLPLLKPIVDKDTSVTSYMELYNGLGQCMHVCNQYHEEAFMLESSLREIMDQIQSREADLKSLETRLQFEIDNYRDLSRRIDSSLNIAIRQAETFYRLKPEIDRIREQVQLP